MESNFLKRIMLIDDDRLTNFVNKALIENTKICDEVTVFSDGLDALKHLECLDTMGQDLPEIIMIDINLPGIDGHELIHRIQALKSFYFPKCMLVYLTNSKSYLDLIKAEKNDIEYFIRKPLDNDHIKRLQEEFVILNSSSQAV